MGAEKGFNAQLVFTGYSTQWIHFRCDTDDGRLQVGIEDHDGYLLDDWLTHSEAKQLNTWLELCLEAFEREQDGQGD